MDINNLIRIGTVSSINPEKAKARILLEDRDETVTAELPIIFNRTLDTQDYNMVKVGEQVLCLFLNNGLEEGFILGSFYTEIIKPPVNDKDKRLIVFEDGTLLEYYKGDITINAAKNINIISAESITIESPTGLIINGNVQVNGTITSSGGA